MDEFTRWDDGLLGPGTYTAWDAAAGQPGETFWDLLPEFLSRTIRVAWQAVGHAVGWADVKHKIRW